jgi:peptidoglycan/xylan/chitin deacetylase (PgdA/CDA1 family)/tetratricopeptide (TPR) repeat protein
MDRKELLRAAAILLAAAAVWFFVVRQPEDRGLSETFRNVTADFRRIIVLMDGAESLDQTLRARCVAAGRVLFWRKQQTMDGLGRQLSGNGAGIRQLVRYLSSEPGLHDGDKLAFLDLVDELDSAPVKVAALSALRDDLQSIQLAYREEVTRIFSQFAKRGATPGTREKWDQYVAGLRRTLNREKLLEELGIETPEEPAADMRGASNEVFGNDFASKTVALTFDDGPHPKYTEQILALLRKYGIKACFFELGSNISRSGDVAHKVFEAGHILANHSYSHPVLSKLSEAQRQKEIEDTSALLEKTAGKKTQLFRPPYGARNAAILQQLQADGLRSIMWNIDSMDWADPIPESIAMRVLHEIDQRHKGIILFHDIHKQSVLSLSTVIEELQRQNYTFLEFDKGQFVKSAAPAGVERASEAPATAAAESGSKAFYRESWAVIIGINDYEKWPKLRYAVNDADGIEKALVTKFGFKKDRIRKLTNGEATRQRILEVLGDELTDGSKVNREDRVFFFFAGHGATRTFEDGRQLGFIVPVDAGQSTYYSTAISMTTLREASDLIPAKHVYFVMDSCYSGLALSRGSGAYSKDKSYLDEVTRRSARQILTAGGADQQVSDDGPGGHSVFTWALLEGLEGKADLDGNGVITASELGAYISPIVAQFARQTPSVGNLVGSEGGEFLFELQPQPLTAASPQLDTKALRLTEKLSALEHEIAARQDELLKLQQSIQSESVKLAQAKQTETAKPKAVHAFDLDRQGQQLYREKKYEEALEKFKAAVQMKPNDVVLMNNLGFIYYAMGRYDDALVYLKKTLAADPKRKEAHQNIADTYMKMGRTAEAKQHYEQFLELYPSTPRAEEIRGILQTLKQGGEAR